MIALGMHPPRCIIVGIPLRCKRLQRGAAPNKIKSIAKAIKSKCVVCECVELMKLTTEGGVMNIIYGYKTTILSIWGGGEE